SAAAGVVERIWLERVRRRSLNPVEEAELGQEVDPASRRANLRVRGIAPGPGWRGGVFAVVLDGGRIRRGDSVAWIDRGAGQGRPRWTRRR
ncbi:MAG: hypothetical protein GWM92_07710, partial [Gemmatimonadetes bacterium]|nr:hypothetical protein [Gemmatimonadota bacterium]NIR77786.1 hypothetical protein [Gemmatimonadota bacterium]NIT87125.1 hypothetical protein [Gemmatimonadota bacterium]NIU30159.1 hypothetical protein [Gemmatimonadota bacterium]NIU35093.1 hypothetical protein [Gemmatimonadota bacterium]